MYIGRYKSTCISVLSHILGISIVDSDLTTDIVEPADFNRYVSDRDYVYLCMHIQPFIDSFAR